MWLYGSCVRHFQISLNLLGAVAATPNNSNKVKWLNTLWRKCVFCLIYGSFPYKILDPMFFVVPDNRKWGGSPSPQSVKQALVKMSDMISATWSYTSTLKHLHCRSHQTSSFHNRKPMFLCPHGSGTFFSPQALLKSCESRLQTPALSSSWISMRVIVAWELSGIFPPNHFRERDVRYEASSKQCSK